MELKQVIPDMDKTFGILEYAGKGEIIERRINGKIEKIGRTYNLYSDKQRADNIAVIIPFSIGEKEFEFDEKVRLVNPRITAEGYNINNRGFTNYLMYADDILKV